MTSYSAKRIVVERLAVHVHHEGVTDVAHRIPLGVLQHAGRVDGDVALRVAQDGEDVGRRRGDGALDFDAFGHVANRVSPGDCVGGAVGISSSGISTG